MASAALVSAASIAVPTAIASTVSTVVLIPTAVGAVTASISPAESVVVTAPVSVAPAAVISMIVTVATTIVAVSVITSVVARPIAAIVGVVPGTCSDENAADEVVRAVIAVWRAGIWVIGVVAVGAHRRRTQIVVTRAYPHTHRHLRLRQ